ncbi:MAG: hypothetical protein JWN95_2817 [Frankiales bacterium]|nr:hypothetical protein [Frankiales bacterium]
MNELVPADDVPPLGRITEALSAHADVASLTRVLTGTLADVLPAELVEVSYERSMGDRMHGRPGRPVGITISTGDKSLILQQRGSGRTDAFIARTVRNVVISRAPVSITEWVAALAAELSALGEQSEATRAALTRLLLG